jgi:ATP-dependent protease Clp ATPase subunit
MKRSRKPRVCSFCGTPQHQVQRLIAGPNVSICDACVARFRTSPEAPQEERGLRCSFYGKKQRQVSFLAVGPQGISICNACLDLCQEILTQAHPRQC